YEILRAVVFADNDCGIVFEVRELELCGMKKKVGPSIFNSLTHRTQFREKSKNVWVEEDRLVSEEKRTHTNMSDFLYAFLKKPVSKLTYGGVPNRIAKEIHTKFDIFLDSKVSKIKSDEFWRWMDRKAF
ncbi:MAG: hypothetical protein KAS12_05490, partial [Candidatus Aenigmarchaeota archaeon]|nr:hypothetical protein [Candidatus Aenigmarchaeota archaeon]